MPPTIWVSQSLPRAETTASQFRLIGVEPVIAPALKIETLPDERELPPSGTVLIFTSRHGVSAFSGKHDAREFEVVCVGDATASLAREKGFYKVSSAQGDAKDVIAWIKKTVPDSTYIMHCTGPHAGRSIIESLRQLGYKADWKDYYISKPHSNLPLKAGGFDYITVYSPMAARVISAHLGSSPIAGTTILSISETTDTALGRIGTERRLVAKAPNQDAMEEALRLDLQIRKGLS
ncbi:uroporphyrinogen-III synthase [Litorimonas taeanensis]|uniref:Uroporphyrinogen-III synthase n=2 Tax=Litorimonas taeanensis TaxID=568099 RepID=A0A420WII8_9PROT|nr:uroporphyrinogen-III synthase [Litorimonas taeanensis]